MSEINCYIPIKVRITGRLSDTQLDQLGETLVRALAARISFAQRTIASHIGGQAIPGGVELLREQYEPSRADAETGTYSVPSYQRSGAGETRRVSMQLEPRRGSRLPWIILRSLDFHARVGRFLEYLETIHSKGEKLPDKVLYLDHWDELHWVSAWWVQVNQSFLLSELLPILVKRAGELSRVQETQSFYFGYTAFDVDRKRLIEIDEDRIVESQIPSLSRHNTKLVHEQGGDRLLRPGAWLLFTSIVLPEMHFEDLALLQPKLQATVRLRELAFIIPTEEFELATHLSWEAYIQEFGDGPQTLYVQPFTVRRRVNFQSLVYAVEKAVSYGLAGPDTFFFGGLEVLNRSALDALPAAIRGDVAAYSNPLTRSLSESQTKASHWEANWNGGYIYAVLYITEENLSAARLRPEARRLAPLLLAKLQSSSRELLRFLKDEFGDQPRTTRPAGGNLFEFVLEELKGRGAFNALFDVVEGWGHIGLHQHLLRLSLGTSYATDERVRRSQDLLLERARRRSEQLLRERYHIYREQEQEIWLDRDPETKFGVGDTLIIGEREEQGLKPSLIPAFREALEKERKALMERIAEGEDTKEYTEDDFTREVLGKAAQRMKLSEDDFKVAIQRGIRLLRIEPVTKEGLLRYYIHFEFVERVKAQTWLDFVERMEGKQTWQTVSKPQFEIEDQFEARLIYLSLGRTAEFYRAMGMGITVVGLFAVAWSAGIVSALVAAAGGKTVVLISIGISELIFIIRVVFTDTKLTLRGFLEAAIEGYLMALGFRPAGFLGRLVGKTIHGEAFIRNFGGWVAERLVAGTVGGAGTAVLTTFSHDMINVIITGRGVSGIDTYVRNMAWGALLGTVFEFGVGALQPILRAGGETGLQTLAEVVKRVREEGFTAATWTGVTKDALANLYGKLREIGGEVAARGFTRAMAERLVLVGEQLAGQYRLAVFRRVLELSPGAMSRQSIEGLEKFLNASPAELTDQAALALVNRLDPAQLRLFLEGLGTLDQLTINTLARVGRLEALAGGAAQPAKAASSQALREQLNEVLDDLLARGPTAKGPTAGEVDQAVARLGSGATTAAGMLEAYRVLLRHVVELWRATRRARLMTPLAEGQQPIDPTGTLNHQNLVMQCGGGRDVTSAALASYAKSSGQDIMILRHHTFTAFKGATKAEHSFSVVIFSDGTAFIVDPTFGQFLKPGHVIPSQASLGKLGKLAQIEKAEQAQLAAEGATGAAPRTSGTVLRSDVEGLKLLNELVEKGVIPLTPKNAELYALALEVNPSQIAQMAKRLTSPARALRSETVSKRGARVRQAPEADIWTREEMIKEFEDLIKNIEAHGGARELIPELRKLIDKLEGRS